MVAVGRIGHSRRQQTHNQSSPNVTVRSGHGEPVVMSVSYARGRDQIDDLCLVDPGRVVGGPDLVAHLQSAQEARRAERG